MFFVALAAAAAGAALVVVVAQRRHVLPHAVGVGVALAAVLWMLDLWWVQSDPTGAGGWIDCWPGCSLKQEVARLGFWLPPMFVTLLLLGAGVAVVLRRRHARRS